MRVRPERAVARAVQDGGSVDAAGSTSSPTVIEPPRAWEMPGLKEIWEHRELLYFLAWRDIKVRYKQTVIGAAWAILQPFLTMVVFSLIFGGLLAVPSDGVPYPVFSYAALLPWTFFASGLTHASNSLVHSSDLVSKIYFPRLILPLAAILAPAVDFALAFIVLLAMLMFYGIVPGLVLVTLPLFLFLALLTVLALGLWLSALNVKYRDIGYVVPFLIQFLLFVTPVAYPSTIIPAEWRGLYGLNPMAGVVDGFRWALLGSDSMPTDTILLSFVGVLVLLVSGVFYFRRVEAEFADVV